MGANGGRRGVEIGGQNRWPESENRWPEVLRTLFGVEGLHRSKPQGTTRQLEGDCRAKMWA